MTLRDGVGGLGVLLSDCQLRASTLQATGLKDLGPAVLPSCAKGQIKAFLLLLRNARQVTTGGHEEVETERQWSQRSDNAGQQLRRNAFSACY